MATVHPEPQAGLAEAPCGLPQARRSKVNFVSVARKAALAEAPGQVSLAKAVLAAKADKNQAATRAPSAAPVTAPKMVDCNRTFGLHKMVSKSSLIRRRQRRHAAPPPVPGIGAAKLERDVGDTVASVAISEDDMCAPLFLCVPCDHAPEVHICNVDCSRIPHMLTITVLAHVSSWRPSPPRGRLFAAGTITKKVTVYSTTTGDQVATFTAKQGINAVAFAGVGSATRLLAGTFGGQIAMWRVEGGEGGGAAGGAPECETSFGSDDNVHGMAVGARGTRLAVGGAKGNVAM